MKKIDVSTQKHPNTFTLVDDEDFYELDDMGKWYYQKRKTSDSVSKIYKKKSFIMHRFIMNAPKGMDVDHINHDSLDNRKQNLRICTRSENMQNMCHENNKPKGITYFNYDNRKKKWRARIKKNYHYIYLGYYKTKKEAIKMYNCAARILFGAYDYLNEV